MRILFFLISAAACIGLIVILDTKAVLPAPLGRLLSPQHGLWQNAEPVNTDYSFNLSFPELKGTTSVYVDERLVPHVVAENDADAFFVQGYLHAKFRLWQMEFQTMAAGGRLCEILGEKSGTSSILNLSDRYFRRLGMTYAAEKSLKMIEADPATAMQCNSYTAGVNAYIGSLNKSALPPEYKLLGYQPELWTNLKTALFLKYMSFDLAGYENDFEYTAARNAFTRAVFEKMYPLVQDSMDPIVPKKTLYDQPLRRPVAPSSVDSLYLTFKDSGSLLPVEPQKPNRENGSNNWAVSGTKTKSGYPILCNDPHLGLNLPSIWFEMQIQTPSFNAYGASFPCAPGIIIGFNDSCAFGVTNAGRDVRDYYEIKFRDRSKQEYWFDSSWKKTDFRIERYKVKGQPDFIDTVAYTVFGPVLFDEHFASKAKDGKSYAVRWKAHDASNEVKTFYELDKANNYVDYVRAARNLHTPGQNIVFASKNGDIAMRAQGEFPAKWKRQGDFVMPGTDSSYMWQGMIPQAENPRMYNPERGFVSSANQAPADTSYPYYLGSEYPPYRGLIINRRLRAMNQITVQDMMRLQTDNYNIFAEYFRPLMLRAVAKNQLPAEGVKYWEMLQSWNLRNDPGQTGPTIFTVLYDSLKSVVWDDELASLSSSTMPYESTLLEGLLKDSAFQFLDNIHTTKKETLTDDVLEAFRRALPVWQQAEAAGRLQWSAYKDARITHLTRLAELSRLHIKIGGGAHSVNAMKVTHGPSWRMVVHLTPKTEAYGIYPGGQNGNPGSRFYDNFINNWASGAYYPLFFMGKSDTEDSRIRWKMQFQPLATK